MFFQIESIVMLFAVIYYESCSQLVKMAEQLLSKYAI